MYSFLMLGQSNMAGRGAIGEVEAISCERAYMLRNGIWVKMREPVNVDKAVYEEIDGEPLCGISPAASFLQEFIESFDCEAGLIPCAHGGTSLEMWSVGGSLYTNAVMQGMLAKRTSTIAGILWHQGESDSKNESDAKAYEEKFMVILESIKRQLDIPDVPVIMGELGSFLGDRADGRFMYYKTVNKALAAIAEKNEMYVLAKADGLTDCGDKSHFDSASQREFGRRYFKAYAQTVHRGDWK